LGKYAESFAFTYSDFRTHELSNLTKSENERLIKYLESLSPADIEKNKVFYLRQNVLVLLNKMGWCEFGLDFDRLNAFMLKDAVIKKPLKDYTSEELPGLIEQFKQLAK
jgi:hypothetical protein